MKYRVDKVNSWNGWDPLKQVILGNVFEPKFFRDIPDLQLRDLLTQLLEETHEDLDNIQKTLEGLGIDVVRVAPNNTQYSELHEEDLGWSDNVMDYCEQDKGQFFFGGIPKPCLSPRDFLITLGDKLMQTNMVNNIHHDNQSMINPACVDNRLADGFLEIEKQLGKGKDGKDNTHPGIYRKLLGPLKPRQKMLIERFGKNFHTDMLNGDMLHKYCNRFNKMDIHMKEVLRYTWSYWAPMITRVGDTLIIDTLETENLDEYILDNYPVYKKANVAIGGHNDGSFNLPKPGLGICAPWVDPNMFKDTLPGWEILKLDVEKTGEMTHDFGNETFGDWRKEKNITQGKWWHPDAKQNPQLVNFINKWLNNWVGFAEETIFEVNMLSVDEKTIISLNHQEDIHKKLEEHGINPIYCRFRHRNFWDAGLHCLTVDTLREGNMQSYFK